MIILVIVTGGSLIAWEFGKFGQWLLLNGGRFQTIYVDWSNWLEAHGVAIIGPITNRFDVRWLIGALRASQAGSTARRALPF